jgi:hypothetical protein
MQRASNAEQWRKKRRHSDMRDNVGDVSVMDNDRVTEMAYAESDDVMI